MNQLADLYKVAETDALINYFSKLAIRSCRDTSPQKLKEGTKIVLEKIIRKFFVDLNLTVPLTLIGVFPKV